MALMKRKKQANRRVDPAPRRHIPVRGIATGAVLVGAVTLLAWAAARLADPDVLPVKYVEVSGDLHHVAPAQIRDRVTAVLRGNFFTANTGTIRRELTAVSWVYSARVSRVWPDTLSVVIVEQQPVARWGEDAMVNLAGEVFHAPMGDAEKALPVLRGPADDVLAVVQHYETAVAGLRRLNVGIRDLSLDERHAWRVELSNGVTLVLGRQEYDKRLERFSELYKQVMDQHADRVGLVDLRYSNGFAIRWRDTPSA
jgi:cell division protein FtsQ